MKLFSYRSQSGIRLGIRTERGMVDAGPVQMAEAFGHLDELKALAAKAAPLADGAGLELVAPVLRPEKIICVGLNYRDHAAETRMAVPTQPILFAKWANAVVGPGADVRIPPGSQQMDYEAELGVIIGRTCSNVSKAEALSYVGGYTCVNDVSARDLQFAVSQWTLGKVPDTFLPSGPYVVTPDEIPDPQALRIGCRVNGEVRQDSTTGDMIFSVAELISYISRYITLSPGDVIATGTPPGVAMGMEPKRWLQSGDTVTVFIEGIGELTNRMVAVTPAS